MHSSILPVADGFWNIRGSFKVARLVEIGTHASLVRRRDGKFVLLDSYTPSDAVQQDLDAITGGREGVEAILNLHPFHTVHVKGMHARYPHARLYGTSRHLHRFPDLPWQKATIDSPAAQAELSADLDFSVPRGVDLVSANERVHFSSVLVLHRDTKTIHVDDTLMFARLPAPLRAMGKADTTRFHPTLGQALERRPRAAEDFREWARELCDRWGDAENLCAAHLTTLTARENTGASIRERILKALHKVEKTLAAHERAHG